MKRFFLLFILIAFFYGCKKNNIEPPHWVPILTTTASDFSSVFFTDKNTGYVGGSDINSDGNGFIIKTTDGGKSWIKLPIGKNILEIESIYFLDANNGFAVNVNGKLFKTTNGGAIWSVSQINKSGQINSVYFTNAKTGYVVNVAGQILKTTDGGNTWTVKYFDKNAHFQLKSVFFTDTKNGYVVGTNSLPNYEAGIILTTTDGGETWSKSDEQSELNSVYFPNESVGYAAGASMILKTVDGGKTWKMTFAPPAGGFLSIYFTDANTGYTVTLYGLIFKTIDGGKNWTELGSTKNSLRSVFFTKSGVGYAVGDGSTILKWK